MQRRHRFKRWLFSVREGRRSITEIIFWWELRRIPYNLLVAIGGLLSLLLVFFFASRTNAIQPGEDVVEPLALLAAPIVINVFYTAGWIVEAFLAKPFWKEPEALGPKLLRAGLELSLFMIALPPLFWGISWCLAVVGLTS